jgi:nucleotide-binding universal stress UspA family protein
MRAGAPVVVGVDGSPGSRAALVWAAEAAARRGAGLTVLASFPVELYWGDPYLLDAEHVERVRADVAARARALVDEVRGDPALAARPGLADLDITVVATPGPAAATLVHAAQGAALLVVGSRGRGAVRSAVLGSVALHCAAHAPCPVVVVHPRADAAFTPPKVVVGLDGSEAAGAALRAAVSEAGRLGAGITAVTAWSSGTYWSDAYDVVVPPAEQLRADARRRVEQMVADADTGAVPVDVEPVEGPPGEVLVRQAEGAELLVVGGRGNSPLAGLLLGSVALHCVVHAPCPVMVVPSPHGRAGAAR